MNAKRSLLFTALAALPLAIASNTAQAQSYEMVIATQLPEDMSNNEIYPALVHFKNLVEARTEGGVAPFEEVSDTLPSFLGRRQQQEAVENYVRELREQADIKRAM